MNKRFASEWLRQQFKDRLYSVEVEKEQETTELTEKLINNYVSYLGMEKEYKELTSAERALAKAEKRVALAKAIYKAMGHLAVMREYPVGYEKMCLFKYGSRNTPEDAIGNLAKTNAREEIAKVFDKRLEQIKQDFSEAQSMLAASTSPKTHIRVCEQLAEEFDLEMPQLV